MLCRGFEGDTETARLNRKDREFSNDIGLCRSFGYNGGTEIVKKSKFICNNREIGIDRIKISVRRWIKMESDP